MTEVSTDFKPKPVRRRGEARRRAILDAAAQVFFEKGYEATSLSDIVARAGGSRTLIYEQFRDKDGLFEAMMNAKCAEILEPLNEASFASAEPAVALRALGRRFMEVMSSAPAQALLRIVIAEGAKFPNIARAFFERGHDVAYARLREYFERLTEARKLHVDDPASAAVLFFAMVQGDAVQRMTAGAPDQLSKPQVLKQIDDAVEMIVAAYRPK